MRTARSGISAPPSSTPNSPTASALCNDERCAEQFRLHHPRQQQELAIESFFPADEATRFALQRMAAEAA